MKSTLCCLLLAAAVAWLNAAPLRAGEEGAGTIRVEGAVKKPGVYALSHRPCNLLEALALADGPADSVGIPNALAMEVADLRKIRVTRVVDGAPQTFVVDTLGWERAGEKFTVLAGDEIHVPKRSATF